MITVIFHDEFGHQLGISVRLILAINKIQKGLVLLNKMIVPVFYFLKTIIISDKDL
jgi:hypothetical protein